jgi:DNA-binding transcriptional regulator PaaX
LKSVSDRYATFIKTHGRARPQSELSVSLAYYAVLKDDPQLPFSLEPKGFLGKKAHAVFRQLFQKA